VGIMSEYRDYENGVADVLAYLAGESATVRRNVQLRGRSGGRPRQIDVLVTGRIFGMANATLVVDCKRWGTPIDVNDVESFIGLVNDVGAEVGMMVTTRGSTEGARNRASTERGVRLEVMSLEELKAWSPRGTVTTSYRLPADRQADVEKVLRNAGFRVAPNTSLPGAEGEVLLDVIRHYGTTNPSGEVQERHMAEIAAGLRILGVEPVQAAHGIVIGGGTPAHRWLALAVNGVPIGLKVLAATKEEAEQQLDQLVGLGAIGGIPRQALSVITADGWPVALLFGS
jgi:Restriction endonuclease